MRALWLIALVLAAKGAFAYTICGFPGPSVVGFDDFIGTIARGDVAYVGEIHTDAQVHAAQLDTLRGLAALDRPLVLAMEMFQIPYQQYLDAYIRGELSEEGLFRETEYATRWGYDPGLYSPILRLAKEQHIPLRAIGVPTELIEQVRQKGATNTQSPYLPSPILCGLKQPTKTIPGWGASRGFSRFSLSGTTAWLLPFKTLFLPTLGL